MGASLSRTFLSVVMSMRTVVLFGRTLNGNKNTHTLTTLYTDNPYALRIDFVSLVKKNGGSKHLLARDSQNHLPDFVIQQRPVNCSGYCQRGSIYV